MPAIKGTYNPYKNDNWKKSYRDNINIIYDSIKYFGSGKDEKPDGKSIDKININEIEDYSYGFTSRFFYGIYDFEKKKGWVRLSGVSTDDFLIKVGFIEDGYFDVNILNNKGVYGKEKEIENWKNIRYKNRFKNNNGKCYNLESLALLFRNLGSNTEFIEILLEVKNKYIKGDILYKRLFNTQLKGLKLLRRGDKDRINLKPNQYCDDITAYKEIYGYTPKERYIKKYNLMLNYIGKENKVLLYILFNKNYKKSWFVKRLLEISNSNNLNFKERKKYILEKYKELFINKK